MDYSQLQTELSTDPENLGYAALVAAGSDSGLVDLLNAVGSGSAYVVTVTTLTKDQALVATTPIVFAITRASILPDANIIAYWSSMLDHLRAADQIDVPTVAALLDGAIADGVLTQDQVTAATTRQGSRAEVLFGAGTVITDTDVAIAQKSEG